MVPVRRTGVFVGALDRDTRERRQRFVGRREECAPTSDSDGRSCMWISCLDSVSFLERRARGVNAFESTMHADHLWLALDHTTRARHTNLLKAVDADLGCPVLVRDAYNAVFLVLLAHLLASSPRMPLDP